MQTPRLRYTILLSLVLLLFSCNSERENKAKPYPEFVALPGKLINLPDSTLMPLLNMLEGAEFIGISEGTHGMNEPLDFRNEVIKFLVKQKRIDFIAFESGQLEGQLVDEYINGAKGNLDTVVKYGVTNGFHQLPQNRSLIEWLRNYNMNPVNKHKVKFYGFDITGSPINRFAPQKLNSSLQYTLNYLKNQDPENWKLFQEKFEPLMSYVYVPVWEDEKVHFYKLDSNQRAELTATVNELLQFMKTNKLTYGKSNAEKYEWALQSMVNAKEVDDFLNHPIEAARIRENSMFSNLQWILNREKGKNALLFAHMGHIHKEIIVPQSDSVPDQHDMLGEQIHKVYGEKYKVIGNFYRDLNQGKDTVSVAEEAYETKLGKNKCANFYQQVNKKDSMMIRKWNYALSTTGSKFYMHPVNAVDVIFFTRTQTSFDLPE